MKKIIGLFMAGVLGITSTGCAPLIIGAAVGGGAVYATSKDTLEGDSDKSYESLWQAALSEANKRAIVKQQDESTGYIYADSGSTRIWIRLVKLTRSTTRIKISSRKFHLPNLKIAQDLFLKIVSAAE